MHVVHKYTLQIAARLSFVLLIHGAINLADIHVS